MDRNISGSRFSEGQAGLALDPPVYGCRRFTVPLNKGDGGILAVYFIRVKPAASDLNLAKGLGWGLATIKGSRRLGHRLRGSHGFKLNVVQQRGDEGKQQERQG